MARHETRKSKRPFYYSWPFLTILAIIFIFFIKSAYTSFEKKRSTKIQQDIYQERLDNLDQKKIDLEAKIQRLETDRGREDELRTRFDVVKDGEKVIKIIEDE